MANEAIPIEKWGKAVRFTVADGTGIEKGTVCKLSDPRTAAASSGADQFAGIAATEKVASDGSTSLGLWRGGIFDLKATGAIVCGTRVCLSGANLVKQAVAADIDLGKDFGTCLETAAHDEVVSILVDAGGPSA